MSESGEKMVAGRLLRKMVEPARFEWYCPGCGRRNVKSVMSPRAHPGGCLVRCPGCGGSVWVNVSDPGGELEPV